MKLRVFKILRNLLTDVEDICKTRLVSSNLPEDEILYQEYQAIFIDPTTGNYNDNNDYYTLEIINNNP